MTSNVRADASCPLVLWQKAEPMGKGNKSLSLDKRTTDS